MNYEAYTNLKISDDFSIVDFISSGAKGNVAKRILITPTEITGIYNLAFGDLTEDNEIDDYCISGNGDRNKVLGTVVDVVKAYTQRYPDRYVFFKGSTKERTRLYRMAIGINIELFSAEFEIYSYVNEALMPFEKNSEVTAFLVKRKIV